MCSSHLKHIESILHIYFIDILQATGVPPCVMSMFRGFSISKVESQEKWKCQLADHIGADITGEASENL